MKFIFLMLSILLLAYLSPLSGQSIGAFPSLTSEVQDAYFHVPVTHSFQVLQRVGDALSLGGSFPNQPDFTGFVPKENSARKGYLCINSEENLGGVTIFEIAYDSVKTKGWSLTNGRKVDFSAVNGTTRNCSGTITPWNTFITCEEGTSSDGNGDGYFDWGWCAEINPQTGKLVDYPNGVVGADKIWAMGNFAHENVSVHPNLRTVYEGADMGVGYLYKFVADSAKNLSKGTLYVYVGAKEGTGAWVALPNLTPFECNNTLSWSANVNATVFSGIEDVEYNPHDSMVYVAVKNENTIYRFKDDSPLAGGAVSVFERFVGNQSYPIMVGQDSAWVDWGTGNDNLAIDEKGNLWVFQDGSRNHIWVVEKGHTQAHPKVKIFGHTPLGAEPTGITFTPDFRYLFMSIQHPSSLNDSIQPDAWGNPVRFQTGTSLVIARREFLGTQQPVQLISHEANLFEHNVDIHWRIGLESDSLSSYSLFHSLNGREAVEIATFPKNDKAAGFRNYHYLHEKIPFGKNTYKIRLNFKNNTHLGLAEMNVYHPEIPMLLLTPNPSSQMFELYFPENFQIANVKLIDTQGKICPLHTEIQQEKILGLGNSLANGVYTIRVEGENGQLLQVKWVVQNQN